ncbi:hypothetical protein O3P69_000310 [Scylla paramamosain]|uniref:Uncharacterized protein n=1 Tax=Scylla paramamosain TaxID=85552 RepID=A0AAW0UYA9_SCYPA
MRMLIIPVRSESPQRRQSECYVTPRLAFRHHDHRRDHHTITASPCLFSPSPFALRNAVWKIELGAARLEASRRKDGFKYVTT